VILYGDILNLNAIGLVGSVVCSRFFDCMIQK